MWAILGAVGGALLITVVALLVVWNGGGAMPGAEESTGRPVTGSSSTPVALEPSSAPTSTATADSGTPHPSSCEQLYSPAMVDAFGDKVLNPSWTKAPGSGVRDGTADPELVLIIDAAEHLTCVWGSEAGGSDSGLTTNLVWVTPEQATAVRARLSAAGYTCYEELSGVRCLTETATEAGSRGESHFVRDGIWLATKYVNSGPDGYTHDIVTNVWDGA